MTYVTSRAQKTSSAFTALDTTAALTYVMCDENKSGFLKSKVLGVMVKFLA